jgi:hypothetical protein
LVIILIVYVERGLWVLSVVGDPAVVEGLSLFGKAHQILDQPLGVVLFQKFLVDFGASSRQLLQLDVFQLRLRLDPSLRILVPGVFSAQFLDSDHALSHFVPQILIHFAPG